MSVCPSRSSIVSKQVNILSDFFHHLVDPPFWFFHTKHNGSVLTLTPLTGRGMQFGYEKIQFFKSNQIKK